MIEIDGIKYNATWLQGVEQSAEILNGEGSGRLQGTGDMYLEYVGTFINHTGSLRKNSDCSEEEWNSLFLTLINPINEHTVKFPFGVNEELTQKVYIVNVIRRLKLMQKTNKWESIYEVSFVAKSAAWLPEGSIRGVE